MKGKAKIVSPNMNESEEEFSVDAPKDWNVETLTVGDYITPDMYAIFSRRLSYNKFQHESSKILRFAEDETGETMVTLEFKDEDYSNIYEKLKEKIEKNTLTAIEIIKQNMFTSREFSLLYTQYKDEFENAIENNKFKKFYF